MKLQPFFYTSDYSLCIPATHARLKVRCLIYKSIVEKLEITGTILVLWAIKYEYVRK